MKNKNETVQRMNKCYVAEDCLQLTFRQDENTMTILDSTGMIYHKKDGSNLFVDKSSEKRKTYIFPYSNTPYYKGRNCEYVNQILDFDSMYIQITGGKIIEVYAVKDGKEALVVNKILTPSNETKKICTREEVIDMFENNIDNIYELDGSKKVFSGLVSEEEIFNEYKEWIKANVDLEIYALDNQGDSFTFETKKFGKIRHGYESFSIMKKFCYRSLEKLTIEDIDEKYKLIDKAIFVSMKDNLESIKEVDVIFTGGKYEVHERDYPITKYTYEHIKQLECTNLVKTKETKISKVLNPTIDKYEYARARQWIKKYKR